MPQMASLYWLYLFFLSMFSLFFMLNYFIKHFYNMSSVSCDSKIVSKSWKV